MDGKATGQSGHLRINEVRESGAFRPGVVICYSPRAKVLQVDYKYVTRDGVQQAQALTRGLVWAFAVVVTYGSGLAAIQGISFAGREMRGWVWVIHILLAVAVVLIVRTKPKFPLTVWLPWLIWIVLRCDWMSDQSVQQTLMLTAYIWVGVAASMIPPNLLHSAARQLELSTIALTCMLCGVSALGSAGVLPAGTRYVGEGAGMTLCIAACYHSIEVQRGRWFRGVLWAVCVGCVALSGMRLATATALLSAVIVPNGWKVHSIVLRAALLSIVGVSAFCFVDSLSSKMTYSGSSFMHVLRDPDDLRTSGRRELWEDVFTAARDHGLVGAGGASATDFIITWTKGGHGGHPHCDYLRVYFDYGAIGLTMWIMAFMYSLIDSIRHFYLASGRMEQTCWGLSFAGLASILLLAITDNAILYSAFIGDIVFFAVGISYAMSSRHGIGRYSG